MLLLQLTCIILVYPNVASKEAAFSREGEFVFANLQKIKEGYEIDKPEYLVANLSVKSLDDCQMECIQHEHCLSGVVLKTISQGSFQCLLFNWSSTEFDQRVTSKQDATSFQLQNGCHDDSNPCENGGECIANTGPYKYLCNCTNGFAGRNCQKKCILFDFETGQLDGWSLSGTAFNNQPTYGDNPNFRSSSVSSNLKGNWYIATFENRPSPSDPGGGRQTDPPTGSMISSPFIIKGSTIKFLIGGGTGTNKGRVELLVEGSVIYTATSPTDTMKLSEKTFDVTNHREKTAQIRITDGYSSSWGHVIVDHFEDTTCTE